MGHSANDRTRTLGRFAEFERRKCGSAREFYPTPGSLRGVMPSKLASLGPQRVGFYAMVGQAPTNTLTTTSDGVTAPIAVVGGLQQDLQPRRLQMFNGIFYLKKLDFQVVTQHGSQTTQFFATSTGGAGPPPTGADPLSRNGAFVRLITFTARSWSSFSGRSGYECRSRRFRVRLLIWATLTIMWLGTGSIPL